MEDKFSHSSGQYAKSWVTAKPQKTCSCSVVMGYGYRTIATLSHGNGDSTISKDVDSWVCYVEDRPLAIM